MLRLVRSGRVKKLVVIVMFLGMFGGEKGRFPCTKKFRKFRLGCKWNTRFWCVYGGNIVSKNPLFRCRSRLISVATAARIGVSSSSSEFKHRQKCGSFESAITMSCGRLTMEANGKITKKVYGD